MIVQKISLNIDHYNLMGNWFLPNDSIIGTAILIHGQGDHSQAYREVASIFCQHNIAICAVDLPGHGLSSGKRGDISSMEFMTKVIQTLERICEKKFPKVIRGIVGHSMGGHVVLYHILTTSTAYQFCWLSSPLLKPSSLKPPLLIEALKAIAPLFPLLTVDTGASRAICRRLPINTPHSQRANSLYHRRISLRWGVSLLHSESQLETLCKQCTKPPITLITNGEEDKIVSTQYIKSLFTACSWPNLEMRILPRTLHEPFKDIKKQENFDLLSQWLSTSVISTLMPLS